MDDQSYRRSVGHHVRRLDANWLRSLKVYLGVSAAANLVWEILQLPLYAIWITGTGREIGFAILHCTGGDVLIALGTLMLALMATGTKHWPAEAFLRVMLVTIVLGVGYTIFSEWLNIVVRASWEYAPSMPVVPIIRTGLSPLLQWIVVPILALCFARIAGLQPIT